MATLHQQERLCSAYDAYTRACFAIVEFPSQETFNAVPRAQAELEEAAVACGMPRSEPNLSGWASAYLCALWSRAA